RPQMRRQSRHVKKLETSALAVGQETLGAMRVVKAFGQEARETERFVHRSSEGVAARIRLALIEGRYGVLVGLTSVLGTAAVLLIGVRHVRQDVLTLGQLLMVLGYLAQLYDPLKTISKKAAGIQGYLASAERAFALLDEAPEGQVLLDDVDLREYKLADLRRQFAVVLQESVLFSLSIADNIAYAAPGASRDQVVAAARAANAHEFIERLPQGYETEVGERGVKLSGGQRQRIALARAFLKDSPVLIL